MADYAINWKPEAFRKQTVANLVENAEIVGKFVETDARRRLLSIRDPKWGEKYRSALVARLLTNEVEVTDKEVIIRVGVRRSSSGSHHGFYIEMGSKSAPAHPFLRPSVYENAREILALLQGK